MRVRMYTVSCAFTVLQLAERLFIWGLLICLPFRVQITLIVVYYPCIDMDQWSRVKPLNTAKVIK